MVCNDLNVGDVGFWFEKSGVKVEYRVVHVDLLGVWLILRSSQFPCRCPYIYFNFGEEMFLDVKKLRNHLEFIKTSI